ncbi:methionyl-tRNA formyltransferase [Quadrisphaera granulorum]|uniref:Methionyl-tRNA formyltransferase n=1 Tax=Quadrisphaera granulorum TaxID=317664 RepID=A0A316A008_9ACTN|nr:methionyl-tRNA formyltransferase [Quadrisphaera granulorum]PWJ51171.1 methionyl-tRNA formyltransferase [Quadrisphaera granulorum]SZE97821.1 methionyl-tRNA formyltransferase [Quadrisphaera granulorum]
MRIVFAGTPAVAETALEALLASDHEVVGVVSRPDTVAGRGRRALQSPVVVRALAAGLPVLQPTRASDPDFLAGLAALEPDCCPVVAYGALLPRPVLDVPRLGWVNLHFSLLPAWRGAAPVQRAVMAGDDVTGTTTFLLEEGMDTGPVLGTTTTSIGPRETSGELLARLAVDGAKLLVATLDGLEAGALVPVPQPAEGVSLAPKVTVEDARVRWDEPAFAVDRRVRGVTPAPGAWTTVARPGAEPGEVVERLKIGPVEPLPPVALATASAPRLAPGELLVQGQEVLVGTATVPVRLGEVQPAGKRAMPAAAWARGARLGAGEVLA